MIPLIPGAQAASSALEAERVRMEVITQNIANANTTRGVDGLPYQRQHDLRGHRARRIVGDDDLGWLSLGRVSTLTPADGLSGGRGGAWCAPGCVGRAD